MKKFILVAIAVVALGAIFYVYSKKEAKAPAIESGQAPAAQNSIPAPAATPQTQTNIKGASGSDYTPPQAPSGGENSGSNIQVYEVDYDDAKYSPDSISVKAGDYIFFKNKSSGDFWPVAGSAATIAAYPNFNPKSAIAAGGEYKFQFTKPGDWSFGDNLHGNSAFSVAVSQ